MSDQNGLYKSEEYCIKENLYLGTDTEVYPPQKLILPISVSQYRHLLFFYSERMMRFCSVHHSL